VTSKSTNKASKYAEDGICYQNIKEKTPSTHLIGFNEVDEIITHLSNFVHMEMEPRG
jgi:hypothetical protein